MQGERPPTVQTFQLLNHILTASGLQGPHGRLSPIIPIAPKTWRLPHLVYTPHFQFLAWHAELFLSNPDTCGLAEHLWRRLSRSQSTQTSMLAACFLIALKVEEWGCPDVLTDLALRAEVSVRQLLHQELWLLVALDWAVLKGWDGEHYCKGIWVG